MDPSLIYFLRGGMEQGLDTEKIFTFLRNQAAAQGC